MTNFTLNDTAGMVSDTLVSGVFGSPELTGAFVVLFFVCLIYFYRMSSEVALVVMLPLILSLSSFGYLPDVLGRGVWLGIGIIWAMVLMKLTNR